jgi:hypothetical protein
VVNFLRGKNLLGGWQSICIFEVLNFLARDSIPSKFYINKNLKSSVNCFVEVKKLEVPPPHPPGELLADVIWR